jgi:prepilin-type N-terminal cleavage/methylation domain-containing protein
MSIIHQTVLKNRGNSRVLYTSASQRGRNAFSLVEMLVVIGIMAALAVVGLLATRGISKGASVQGAVSTASSLALAARAQAQTLGLGARLVIDSFYDAANPQHCLRRITILEAVDPDEWTDPSVSEWKLSDKPTLLPKGTYFDRENSSGFGTMQFSFEDIEAQDGSSGNEVLYYEFDGNGRLIDVVPGELAKIIFVAGVDILPSGLPNIPEAMANSVDGFIIRRAGRLAFFESPDQILTQP